MDLSVWISVLWVMCSWTSCTAQPAPAAGTPAASTDSPRRHARAKRCSCASFMDKECVYFCHLDIIWVNTPERVVSYGLGNAPRTRRALRDAAQSASGGARCACARHDDPTCGSFCSVRKRPRRPRAALKTRRLLEEWRARQRRRARAGEGDSSAS